MINYLLDPFIQIENNNGQPVVGAKIYVYYTGSRTQAPIYSDKEGTSLENPAITDTLGNVTIFAETGIFYDVIVYDNEDTLLFSKLNVTPSDSTAADVREVDIEAGYGIQVHKRYQGNKAIYNVAIDPDETATQADVSGKQDKLTAGANIEITPTNTINVVQRKELRVQSPLKVNRTNNYINLYLDTNFTDGYKEKQNEVIYGGASANYISKITQNENGDVSATVDNFVAGANINITKGSGNLTISGKDWTSTIVSAVSGKLDTSATTSWDVTPYSAGSNINITNHVISGKDWASAITSAVSGKLDTSATTSWDVTPYTAGTNINISNHQISLANNYITKYRAPKSVSCNKDGTRYTIFSQGAGTGIVDQYTFSTLYNSTTQKYELELSNDNHRVFDVYVEGSFVDYVGGVRTKIYETSDTDKPIKIELVGAGAGNQVPLYRYTVIFGEYGTGYNVSLYIEYDYNFIINI